LSFDINKDFSSITQIASGPAVVVANPAVPGKTLAGMLEYAKAHPGSIKYGSSGVGTPVHLAGELMQQMTGAQMVHVTYKGSVLAQGCIAVAGPPQALTALIAREYELWAKVVKSGGVKVE